MLKSPIIRGLFLTHKQFFIWCTVAVLFPAAHLQHSFWGSMFEEYRLEAYEVLFLLVGYFLWIINCKQKKRTKTLLRIEYCLILFGIFLTANTLISSIAVPFTSYDVIESLNIYRNFIISTIVSYFIVQSARFTSDQARSLFLFAMLVAVLFALIILSGSATSGGIRSIDTGDVRGVLLLPLSFRVGIGGNSAALYLLSLFFAGYAMMVSTEGMAFRFLGVLFFVLSSASLIMLSTRAVLISAPLMLFVLDAIIKRKATAKVGKKRKLHYSVIMVFWIGLTFVLFFPEALLDKLPSYQKTKIETIFLKDLTGTGSNTLSDRINQYYEYKDVILANPFGYGLSTIYPEYDIQIHSHLLQLVIKGGVVGAICFLMFQIGLTLFWFKQLSIISNQYRPFLAAMIALNIEYLLLSWGYDFWHRFGIQSNYILLCSLTTVISIEGRPLKSCFLRKIER